MESTKELDISLLLFAGTLLVLVLSGGIVFFIYIYRRKLYRQKKSTKQMQQKLQFDLLQNNMELLETERKRVAADLHDGVGGKLSALRLNMARMEKNPGNTELVNTVVVQSKELIDMIIEMTRRISHNIMPPDFEFYNLETAIEDLCDWINESSSIEMILSDKAAARITNRLHQLAIYRIIQELLSNTIKHAAATTITISLFTQQQQLIIVYTDNGCGLDAELPEFKKGLGLKNIKDRVTLLKGTVEYNSSPGTGFECRIQLPI
jgi:two-component system, NarL family, sensor kinase